MSPLINICLLICLLPNLLEAKKFDLKQSQRQLNLETVDSSTRARRGAESVAGSGGGGGRIIRIMIAPPAPHQVTTTKHNPGFNFSSNIFHPSGEICSSVHFRWHKRGVGWGCWGLICHTIHPPQKGKQTKGNWSSLKLLSSHFMYID